MAALGDRHHVSSLLGVVMSDVIHIFKYIHVHALCGAWRSADAANSDRPDQPYGGAATCMACIAVKVDDGDVYSTGPSDMSGLTKCYVTKDGIAHVPTPAPQFGWFFRLCDLRRSLKVAYAMKKDHLSDAVVTCLECINEMET